jgi:hypothetical protein
MKTMNERVFEDFGSDEKLREFLFPSNDAELLKKIENSKSNKRVFKIDVNGDIKKQLNNINNE